MNPLSIVSKLPSIRLPNIFGNKNDNNPGTIINAVPNFDPKKPVGTFEGKIYNAAGDYIGNAPQTGADQQQDSLSNLSKQLQATLARLNQQVYAPKLDFAAIQSKSRASAENAVNPYYTKQLNDFLAEQAAARQRQQSQFQTNVQGLEDQLKQTLEGNEINKTRTTEDVAQNQAGINQTADNFQVDSGQQFEADRIAQAEQLAAAGLTGGIGAQQREAGQTARNTTEKRQEQQFQEKRQEQELFKGRTLADLTRSGELAKVSTEKGKKQAQFDLDSYIEQQSFSEKNKRNDLEASRIAAISDEQRNQSKLMVNQFINSIANPAQRDAAMRAYGGIF